MNVTCLADVKIQMPEKGRWKREQLDCCYLRLCKYESGRWGRPRIKALVSGEVGNEAYHLEIQTYSTHPPPFTLERGIRAGRKGAGSLALAYMPFPSVVNISMYYSD